MPNPGQQPQESPSKNNPQYAPEPMQGTDDTQSEFSVEEVRADRAEDENQPEEQSQDEASPREADPAQKDRQQEESQQGNA